MRPVTIGLLWHSATSGNLGIGALTVSNIALLREQCAAIGRTPRFVLMGAREHGRRYIHDADVASIDIDTRFVVKPGGMWRRMHGIDCVIDIGAGDSFADIYGRKRFAFVAATKAIALLRGVPLLLAPQTIGPFEGAVTRRVAAQLMRRATAIVARDPLSLDVARTLAGRTPVTLAVDVAFALPYEPRPRAAHGPTRIGLNVSGLLYHSRAFGLDIDFRAMIHGFIERVLERGDCTIELITHVVSRDAAGDDDAGVADELAARYPAVTRVPDFAGPSEAKSYISGLDLLIAGRMHACIAAFSSGVPVIPIAYSRKFEGLFAELLGYRHGIPVRGMPTAEAIDYLLGAIDRREALGRDIAASLPRIAEGLDSYRTVLRTFLGELLR